MVELTILALVLLIVVFVVKPGRTQPLQYPLIVDHAGKYHITLAPRLNLAQPFIEDIAKQLDKNGSLPLYSSTLYFEVRDSEVKAHGRDFYLLAITQRNGKLYFQGISSHAGFPQDRLNELEEFAKAVLINIPVKGDDSAELNQLIDAATLNAAQARGINISKLATDFTMRNTL
jgi:hypothetical protein